MSKSEYGQLKQKITLSLTPYCVAQLWLLAMRNRKNSISDMFEQLARGKVKIDVDYKPTDDEIKSFMLRYKPKELDGIPSDGVASHFREIYFTDHTPINDMSDFL